MQPKTFAVLLTCFILIAVINLIRRQKMSFKYALIWFVLSASVIVLAIYDHILYTIAHWAGFTLLSNFIFFLLLIFVILFSLLLTLYINEQNNRTEAMAQAIAKLDFRIKKIEAQNSSKNP